MRPRTLKEAVDRILAGETWEVALAECTDTFLLAPPQARFAVIEEEPTPSGNARLDALVGAAAEYLAKRYRVGRVPTWVSDPKRALAEPWFTTPSDEPAMLEYLAFASPAEFRWRNIFTEEQPLRRARSHRAFETSDQPKSA
jgi:hypothetical protein